MECPQYSIRLEALGYLCASCFFTSCIRRGLVSRDSIVDHHWLPATVSALSVVSSTRVPRRRKFGDVSCTECAYRPRDNFELIPTVTRTHQEMR